MFILFAFIALSAAAVDFNTAKYAIDKEKRVVRSVLELRKCSRSTENNKYMKAVGTSATKYKICTYSDDKCTAGETCGNEAEDMEFVNELPKHIAYNVLATDAQCATLTDASFTIYAEGCIASNSIQGGTHEKAVIEGGNFKIKSYTNDQCTTPNPDNTLKERDVQECGKCNGESQRSSMKCEEYGKTPSTPSGGSTNTVDFNTAKYVIYSNERESKTIYELKKCSKADATKYMKFVPATATQFKMCTYTDDKCTAGETCETQEMESMKYANDLPAHVGYRAKAVDAQCATITENTFTIYVNECVKTSISDQDKYLKPVVEGGKMLVKTYTDNQCKTVDTGFTAEEKGKCGECLSRNLGTDNGVMKCQTYSPPSGGNKNGSIQTFVLFALTILMFFF